MPRSHSADKGAPTRKTPGQGTIGMRSSGQWKVQLNGRFNGLFDELDEVEDARKRPDDAQAKRVQQECDSVSVPRTSTGHAFLTSKTGEAVLP